MKKKLCIILNKKDLSWARKIINKNINNKDFIVIAPTFDGVVAIKNICSNYYNCQDLAWKINKLDLHQQANKILLRIFNIYQSKNEDILSKKSELRKYPIFKMHYLSFFYYLIEMLNSNTYANSIIKEFNPTKIYIGDHNEIYSKGLSNFSHVNYSVNSLSSSFQIICKIKKIKINNYLIQSKTNFLFYKTKKIIKTFYYIKNIFFDNFIYFVFNKINYFSNKKINISNTKKVLFNCENGYYFLMIKNDILRLSNLGFVVYINFVNRSCSIRDLLSVYKTNIILLYNFTPSNLFTFLNFFKNEIKNLKKIFNFFAQSIKKKTLFKNEKFSIKKIILLILKKEIYSMSNTLALLGIYEKKYNKLKIDAVFNHFDLTPLEYSLIFPLKKNKIPTISASHGLSRLNFFREAFSSDYFLTQGSKYSSLLKNIFGKENIFLSKNNLYDSLNTNYDKLDCKLYFNLDPKKPVCIFADESSYLNQDQFINTQFNNINKVIELKKKIPDLQLIFRYHGGFNISNISEYIKSFGNDGIYVQQHPRPLFKDIAKSADLIISHGSSTVLEALSLGVPVIYLTANGHADSFLYGHKHIKIINNFDLLDGCIKKILKKSLPRKRVKKDSIKFFKHFNLSDKNLSDIIIKILYKKKKLDNSDFQDWNKRIESVLRFDYSKYSKINEQTIC